MVRYKNMLGGLEIEYDGQNFVLGALFEKCVLPIGLDIEPPKMVLVSVKFNIGAQNRTHKYLRTERILETNRMGLILGPGSMLKNKKYGSDQS